MYKSLIIIFLFIFHCEASELKKLLKPDKAECHVYFLKNNIKNKLGVQSVLKISGDKELYIIPNLAKKNKWLKKISIDKGIVEGMEFTSNELVDVDISDDAISIFGDYEGEFLFSLSLGEDKFRKNFKLPYKYLNLKILRKGEFLKFKSFSDLQRGDVILCLKKTTFGEGSTSLYIPLED